MPTNTLANARLAASIYAELSGGAAPATITAAINHAPTAETPAIGSSAGSADLIYSKALTLATGTPTDLDLTALTDPLGASINFAHVTGWFLTNLSTVAGEDVTVGGGTNPFLAALTALAYAKGGKLLQTAPNPGIVVDGTHKTFRLSAAAGAAVSVQLTIIGRSA